MPVHYTSEAGVPLGGIGCGKVELCPDGAFRNLTCQNNQDFPVSDWDLDGFHPGGLSEAFAAVAIEGFGARMLKVEDKKKLPGVAPGDISFTGDYPFASLVFSEMDGIGVTLDAFSPLLLDDPHPQYLNSSLPGVVFTLRAVNHGGRAKEVGLAMSFPHIVGLGGITHCRIADKRGNDTQILEHHGRLSVRYIHNKPKVNARVEGAFELSALRQPGVQLSSVIDWWYPDLMDRFGASRQFPGTKTEAVLTDAGAVYNGSMGGVAATRTLKPGEVFEQEFLLTWHFPKRPCNDAPDTAYQNLYARFLPDVGAVSGYFQDHLAFLRRETGKWHRKFKASNLPQWFQRKLINNICTLSTGSLYTADGRFSSYESPLIMNGCMGTIDQRTASHAITTFAFPRLAAAELELFNQAQILEDHPGRFHEHWNLRTGKLDLRLDRFGAVPHDVGRDDFEGGMGQHHHWLTTHWPDLGTVYCLQVYQQAAWTGDLALLDRCFPRMLATLRFQKALDQNDDGVADLWGHGCCTYDSKSFQFYGASPFIATLHLAALRCVMKSAKILGKPEALAELQQDFDRCSHTLETILWNEDLEQYDKWHDPLHANWEGTDRAHGERSHQSLIAQIAGTWFEPLLDLDPLLAPDRRDRVLARLYERHVKPFAFCPPNETGPDPYGRVSWPYYAETYFAANAIWHGKVEEGMEMERRFARAMFEHSGRVWDPPLIWRGEGFGEPHWGRWYMTTPASWFVLQALVGVIYDALTATLRVQPGFCQEIGHLQNAPVFHPMFWGSLDASDQGWTLRIDQLRGESPLTVRELLVATTAETSLFLDGSPLPLQPAAPRESGRRYALNLELASGSTLTLIGK